MCENCCQEDGFTFQATENTFFAVNTEDPETHTVVVSALVVSVEQLFARVAHRWQTSIGIINFFGSEFPQNASGAAGAFDWGFHDICSTFVLVITPFRANHFDCTLITENALTTPCPENRGGILALRALGLHVTHGKKIFCECAEVQKTTSTYLRQTT